MHKFDPNIPDLLQGDVTGMTLTEPAGLGVTNLVVDPRKPFILQIEWEVFGKLAPLWLGCLSDNWRVEVFAESLGGGPEKRIGSKSVPRTSTIACTVHTSKINCNKWEADVEVPAHELPEGDPGGPADSPSGIYKLAVSVFLNSTRGTPGFDLIGFYEGPVIQVESLV